MHVAQISFYVDPEARTPAELLQAWPSLTEVAECAARAGAKVAVFQASQHTQSLEHHGVRFHFMPIARGNAASGPTRFNYHLRELRPAVLHVHGLDFGNDVEKLSAAHPTLPILLQDHAARLPGIWRRSAFRRGFAAADGVAFCAREQAQEFVRAGLMPEALPVFEIPECTSRFTPGDRAEARRITGITGDPAVLWVGHLDSNKDPLTVLEGVRIAAHVLPDLRLHMCFGSTALLPEVRRRISRDPLLEPRVTLGGRVPHRYVERLMRASDLFVLGSGREGSGYSLIEALACGLPPVVTDIPSFRSLTGSGAVARLWPRGDPKALGAALIEAAKSGSPAMRARVRGHFDAELSPDAVGLKLFAAYTTLVSRRSAQRLSGIPA